jgi:hypothetical protein
MRSNRRGSTRRRRLRDILVSLCALFALSSCDDHAKPQQCGTGGACQDGDSCAGFESDFVCVDGKWQCVPSGRVDDPCRFQDAGVDASHDAPRD